MASMLIWMLGIALGVAIMIISAASGQPLLHMGAAALISLVIAILAVRDNRQLQAEGASDAKVSAATARYMGLVWVWGALCLFVTYYFILKWSEWPGFFMAFAIAGALCLFVSNMLNRDAEAGREDATMMKITRNLTIAQLVGMVITVIGLLVDGKMTRYLTPRFTDWAANNIFFFGAIALAAISLNALMSKSSKS